MDFSLALALSFKKVELTKNDVLKELMNLYKDTDHQAKDALQAAVNEHRNTLQAICYAYSIDSVYRPIVQAFRDGEYHRLATTIRVMLLELRQRRQVISIKKSVRWLLINIRDLRLGK